MPTLLTAIILITLVTTARHEGAHALTAWLQGVELHEVRLLPGVDPDLGFYFGYVSRGDGGTWLIDAAPFLAALLWLLIGYPLLRRMPRPSRYWFPVFAVAVISPLADLVYNYQGGLWRSGTDVWDLFAALPDVIVHAFFILAIGLCLGSIIGLRPAGWEPGQ